MHDYDVFDAVEEGRQHPRDYWGSITDLQEAGWTLTFARHRDSDHLENSNFETILDSFAEKFEVNEDYRVEGSSHWAVGWMDQMMVRALQCDCNEWEDANIQALPKTKEWHCETCSTILGVDSVRPIFMEALEFLARLSEYPVLDEEDFSRREYEELTEYLEQEVSSFVRRNEGDTIAEDWEPDNDKIFSYLFDVHNVSTVDDLDSSWIEDAVLAVADQEGKKL